MDGWCSQQLTIVTQQSNLNKIASNNKNLADGITHCAYHVNVQLT